MEEENSRMKDSQISAFAFKTAEKIEQLIKDQADDLHEKNQLLEAKILEWYYKSKDEEFAEHFNIIRGNNVFIPAKTSAKSKVMFKFDNDEPQQIGTIEEGGEFTIKISSGSVGFAKGGKSFRIYIEKD